VLHICRESWSIALKYYSLAFSSRLLRTLYFDFDIDTLFLSDMATLEAFMNSHNSQMEEQKVELHIKSLDVGINFPDHDDEYTYSRIRGFNALEHLIVRVLPPF